MRSLPVAKPCTCGSGDPDCNPTWPGCGMSEDDWKRELAGVRFTKFEANELELNVLSMRGSLFAWGQEQKK